MLSFNAIHSFYHCPNLIKFCIVFPLSYNISSHNPFNSCLQRLIFNETLKKCNIFSFNFLKTESLQHIALTAKEQSSRRSSHFSSAKFALQHLEQHYKRNHLTHQHPDT